VSKKYKAEIMSLEENLEVLKGELYLFDAKARKKAAIKARAVCLNIKKIVHCLRFKLMDEIKSRIKIKRTHTPESIEAAKQKRKATIENKKYKKSE
jgi:hypothetical protein